jgi:hypothetical protein
MEFLKKFFTEVKNFSRDNWIIYVIYLLMLATILYDDANKSSILEVVAITSIHFIADIFIMMMFSAYTRKELKQGTFFQIISMLLFLSVKLYTGMIGGGWHYLAADPIYILAAIKNYWKDVKKADLKAVNPILIIMLSLLIIGAVLIPLGISSEGRIFSSSAQIVQTIGIFLFAVALSITNNEKHRYIVSIVALSLMVVGSAWETVNTFILGKISALALSYTLLPLTVLVYYVKNWPNIMKPESKIEA